MTSMIHRRAGSTLLVSLLLLSVLTTGCNIFSWTHDEGGSSNATTLAQDARAALLAGKYSEALEDAKKGIENDPAPMQEPELRWIAASAVLADAGVNMTSLMDALSNPNPTKVGLGDTPGIATRYDLFNLGPADLLALAQSCPQALGFLAEVLDALRNGDITPADIIGLQFDIELGFSISSLMTAFLTALDENQNLLDGFVQNSFVTIWADTDGGYGFDYTGPGDPQTFIREQLVCPLWDLYCGALIGLNQAYATAIAPAAWGPVTCTQAEVGSLPGTPDDSYIVGQILPFVHDGIAVLHLQYLQTPCP